MRSTYLRRQAIKQMLTFMKLLGKIMIDKYERAYQYEVQGETHTVVLQPRDIKTINELRLFPWKNVKKRRNIFKIYKCKFKFENSG